MPPPPTQTAALATAVPPLSTEMLPAYTLKPVTERSFFKEKVDKNKKQSMVNNVMFLAACDSLSFEEIL